MNKLTFVVPLALAFALTPIGLASAKDETTPALKHHAKRVHHARVVQQSRIACTKLGCVSIPGNCHPETAYYWNGSPTGYDKVVCR